MSGMEQMVQFALGMTQKAIDDAKAEAEKNHNRLEKMLDRIQVELKSQAKSDDGRMDKIEQTQATLRGAVDQLIGGLKQMEDAKKKITEVERTVATIQAKEEGRHEAKLEESKPVVNVSQSQNANAQSGDNASNQNKQAGEINE